MERRALQLGISSELIRRYAREWIVRIADVPNLAHQVRDAVALRQPLPEVPEERVCDVPAELARRAMVTS